MELILAIFFGAVLFTKINYDKSVSRTYKKQHEEERAVKERWISGVENAALEREIALLISNDDFLDAVSQTYDAILDGKSLYDLYPIEMWCKREREWTQDYYERFQEKVCRYNEKNALRILMAKHGFIPRSDASSIGYVRFPDEPQDMVGLAVTTALDAKVLLWCADELKRHGVKGTFVAPHGKYGTQTAHWNIERGGV